MELLDIDIRRMDGSSPPTFMMASLHFDRTRRVVTITTEQPQTHVFTNVSLYDINGAVTRLSGMQASPSGSGYAPVEWLICVAHSAF